MKKTKIAGWLLVAISVLQVAMDAVNGGGFDFMKHFDALSVALGGVGLVFLRNSIQKLHDAVGEKKE